MCHTCNNWRTKEFSPEDEELGKGPECSLLKFKNYSKEKELNVFCVALRRNIRLKGSNYRRQSLFSPIANN